MSNFYLIIFSLWVLQNAIGYVSSTGYEYKQPSTGFRFPLGTTKFPVPRTLSQRSLRDAAPQTTKPLGLRSESNNNGIDNDDNVGPNSTLSSLFGGGDLPITKNDSISRQKCDCGNLLDGNGSCRSCGYGTAPKGYDCGGCGKCAQCVPANGLSKSRSFNSYPATVNACKCGECDQCKGSGVDLLNCPGGNCKSEGRVVRNDGTSYKISGMPDNGQSNSYGRNCKCYPVCKDCAAKKGCSCGKCDQCINGDMFQCPPGRKCTLYTIGEDGKIREVSNNPSSASDNAKSDLKRSPSSAGSSVYNADKLTGNGGPSIISDKDDLSEVLGNWLSKQNAPSAYNVPIKDEAGKDTGSSLASSTAAPSKFSQPRSNSLGGQNGVSNGLSFRRSGTPPPRRRPSFPGR